MLAELRDRWVALTTDERPCPECGGEMHPEHVRDPAEQAHWRGVEADVCEDCGYAERR